MHALGLDPGVENDHVNLRGVAPQRLLHRKCCLIHLGVDIGCDFIGQDIDDPDQPGAPLAVGCYLHRRAVLFYPAR